jgi:hypothetical protein
VLGRELLAEEGVLLPVVPVDGGELLLAGAGIDRQQELLVAGLDRSEGDGAVQDRGGKTPWRAMQK